MSESVTNTITNMIGSLVDKARQPMQKIPSILLLAGSINKPGLSPMIIASRIIQRQSEAGAPVGPSADGSANISEAMERIRVEEIINAIKMDMQIQASIPIGGLLITGVGANEGGPVVITGYNTNCPNIYGRGF